MIPQAQKIIFQQQISRNRINIRPGNVRGVSRFSFTAILPNLYRKKMLYKTLPITKKIGFSRSPLAGSVAQGNNYHKLISAPNLGPQTEWQFAVLFYSTVFTAIRQNLRTGSGESRRTSLPHCRGSPASEIKTLTRFQKIRRFVQCHSYIFRISSPIDEFV